MHRRSTSCVCCFLSQEKSDVSPELSPALSGAREELVSIIRRCAKVQREAGMDVGEDDYLAEVMHPGLMEVSTFDFI